MCLSCRHYLVTKIIQLDADAVQLFDYMSRIELVGSGKFEGSKQVVQLLHPTRTINTALGFECEESTSSVVNFLRPTRREGLGYLRCSTGSPSGQSEVDNSSRVYRLQLFF